MDVLKAITDRRSIRHYDPEKPVSGETIDSLLNAARWAPSWANTQCVRFIVVRDPQMRRSLAGALSEKNPAARAIEGAPVTVVFVAALQTSGYYKGKASDDKNWYLFDTGLSVQNFCLAAHSMGLGTVICGAMDYHAIERLLEVPDGYQVVAMTPVGYPTRDSKTPPRKELGELSHQEKWNPRAGKQ